MHLSYDQLKLEATHVSNNGRMNKEGVAYAYKSILHSNEDKQATDTSYTWMHLTDKR